MRAGVWAPTALFVAVVPAVVVSVAVPQAADAVAVQAVELVLLALSGSCRQRTEKRGERSPRMRTQTRAKGGGTVTRGGRAGDPRPQQKPLFEPPQVAPKQTPPTKRPFIFWVGERV